MKFCAVAAVVMSCEMKLSNSPPPSALACRCVRSRKMSSNVPGDVRMNFPPADTIIIMVGKVFHTESFECQRKMASVHTVPRVLTLVYFSSSFRSIPGSGTKRLISSLHSSNTHNSESSLVRSWWALTHHRHSGCCLLAGGYQKKLLLATV